MQPHDNIAITQPAEFTSSTHAANDTGGAPGPIPPKPPEPSVALKQTPPTANDNTPHATNDNDTVVANQLNSVTPPHTHTESTLAPTSEFMRYVLAALPSRYILRGTFGLAYNNPADRGHGLAAWVLDRCGSLGDFFHRKYGWERGHAEAAFYSSSLGIGSLGLTAMYSRTVYADIKHIFSEAVGAEFGKAPDQVNYNDLRHSENKIVRRTLDNYWSRMWHRLAIDVLFFPAAFIKHAAAGDLVLGLKGAQLFMETWKRKTTMFEDLITFVNNKINPRNGLGQPIVVGEVFDLYQHYSQEFHPERSFTNVIERFNGEGARWAKSEPIFRRITELMNNTYAYKHPSIIDPNTGHAVRQANFPLPTFIYLLGHDLIDLDHPERTQVTVEVANKFGIEGVKEMQRLVAGNMPVPELINHFGVHLPTPMQKPLTPENQPKNENGVIIKGSSAQLDRAPNTHPTHQVEASSIHHTAPYALHAPQLG